MGLTIHHMFKAKDRLHAMDIVDAVHKRATQLQKSHPLKINRYGKTEISVHYPECDTFHLEFAPLSEHVENCNKAIKKAKNTGDYSEMWKCTQSNLLHGKKFTFPDGRVVYKWPKPTEHYYRIETNLDDPLLGKDGWQTADFTKTCYSTEKAHILICDLIDTIRKKHPLKSEVVDEADFCGDKQGNTRDIGLLMKNFRAEWADIEGARHYLETSEPTEELDGLLKRRS